MGKYLPFGYLTVRHGKIHHAIKFGKASISINGPWQQTTAKCECHNQRVYGKIHENPLKSIKIH